MLGSEVNVYIRGFGNLLKLLRSQKLKNKKSDTTNLLIWNSYFLRRQMFKDWSAKDFVIQKPFWTFTHKTLFRN